MAPEHPSSTTTPIDVLTLLPIPSLESLSRPQLEGRSCVWSREPLNAEIVVALGEREHDGRTAFLRATRPAVGKAAVSALRDHCTGTGACTMCRTDPTCPTGRALNRLIRQGTR